MGKYTLAKYATIRRSSCCIQYLELTFISRQIIVWQCRTFTDNYDMITCAIFTDNVRHEPLCHVSGSSDLRGSGRVPTRTLDPWREKPYASSPLRCYAFWIRETNLSGYDMWSIRFLFWHRLKISLFFFLFVVFVFVLRYKLSENNKTRVLCRPLYSFVLNLWTIVQNLKWSLNDVL